jgi:hypothetical protein
VTTVRTYGHEYRAVITCSEDPCSYCRAPRRSDIVGAPVYPTPAEAFAHGRAMARNVYGESVHDVTVQARAVLPWADLAEDDQIQAALDAREKVRRG